MDTPTPRPGRRFYVAATFLYAAAVLGATYPMVLTFASPLPGGSIDPMTHLWTIRWHTPCLLEGRSPFFCEAIQHPVGAPLGYTPPVQLQTLLYIPLSSVLANDVLCYNILWLSAFCGTGLATLALAWRLTR